ncbi:MAG: hypothetical protein JO202_14720, partial [Ktedonobacteraceae bacterium]|nr:hypothetical protein [Ktedonobacteraceae bacterium]
MQATLQGQDAPRLIGRIWQALTELEFVTAFFTWLFMAASRLAEPLMSISAIYIIICAGIPAWKADALYNSGMAVMIAAPEIILPGAFVLAGQASERGDKKARALHAVAWLFVGLTFFTLADLFVFHLSGDALNVLMWGRCAVGIGYSILLRVLTHGQPLQQAAPPPAEPPTLDYQEIARHLKALFPQPAPAPQIDYQEIARTITPLMSAPQVDYKEIAQHIAPMLEATFRATIVREIKATVAPLTGPATTPQLEARVTRQEPVIEGQPKARATKRSTGSLPKASTQGQEETTETRSTEGRLKAAFQQLAVGGERISGRALAPLARVNKGTAAKWLRATHPEAIGEGQQDS